MGRLARWMGVFILFITVIIVLLFLYNDTCGVGKPKIRKGRNIFYFLFVTDISLLLL